MSQIKTVYLIIRCLRANRVKLQQYLGRHVVPGVFTWTADVLLKDGSKRQYKGDVTVVR